MFKNFIEKAKLKKYESMVTQVKALNHKMITCSSRSLKSKFKLSSDRIEKLAILMEMSKRFLGKAPFDVQLLAALAMHDGYVLNMFTGEGKTIAGALASALYSSDGKQVIVTTANEYLSQRDAVTMSPLFQAVGIESGVLGRNDQATVLFMSLTGACLDWLNCLIANNPQSVTQNSLFKADNTVMIVDEIDYSLIELSMSPVHIVNARVSEYNPDLIYNLVLKSDSSQDFYRVTKRGGHELTDAFFEYADQFLINELNVSRDSLNSTHYKQYIEFQHAWIAKYVLTAGVDYIVDNDAGVIKRFNKRTGRSSAGGFDAGVLNFLHKKEGLSPPIENEEIVTSTLKYYIRSFETVVGMSGTSACNKMELNKTYGMKVLNIPPRVGSKLVDHGYAIYRTEDLKTLNLVRFVNKRLSQGRPVLLVCEDNSSANKYFDQFSLTYTDVVLLLGEDEKSEAELIKNAGQGSKLTITTRMCARGTDIVVEHDEGLSLVVSGLGVTDVDDLQLNGRTARAGKKGEVVFFASVKDPLFGGFKEGGAGYKYILLSCQEDNADASFNTVISRDAIPVVRRVQLECVKAMREQRNMIIAYQSPIERQLEIMKKKRFELWKVGSEDGSSKEYINKMIDMSYNEDSGHYEKGKLIIDQFCSLSPHFHAVIVQLLNAHLTTLWCAHNNNMRVLLSDSFSSGAGMDVGKYNNKCHELFDEFAKTLNKELLDYVVGMVNVYLEDFLNSPVSIDDPDLRDVSGVVTDPSLRGGNDELVNVVVGDAAEASFGSGVIREANALLSKVRHEKM